MKKGQFHFQVQRRPRKTKLRPGNDGIDEKAKPTTQVNMVAGYAASCNVKSSQNARAKEKHDSIVLIYWTTASQVKRREVC